MTYEELMELADEYADALKDELLKTEELATMETGLDAAEKTAIALAYECEAINGGNAEKRKAQEAKYLDGNKAIQQVRSEVRAARIALIVQKVRSEDLRTRISLTKAWLYSQGQRL